MIKSLLNLYFIICWPVSGLKSRTTHYRCGGSDGISPSSRYNSILRQITKQAFVFSYCNVP